MSGTVNQALLRAYQRTLAKAASQTSETSRSETSQEDENDRGAVESTTITEIAAAVAAAKTVATDSHADAHKSVTADTVTNIPTNTVTAPCHDIHTNTADTTTAPVVEASFTNVADPTQVTEQAVSGSQSSVVSPQSTDSVDSPADLPSVESFSIDTLPKREPRFAESPIRASRSEVFRWNPHLQHIESAASESLTRIANQIQTWTRQRPVSVGIASLRPSQGVTSLAVLIAKVLGERGLRTVLIDADRESPGGVSRYVGVSTTSRSVQEDAESLDEAYMQETQNGMQMLTDPRSLATELSKRLIRNADSELELLPSHGLTQNPAMTTSVLEAMVGQLCGDRDCVLLDCGVLLEPPFNAAPVTFAGERLTKSEDAVVNEPRSKVQTITERCHLAVQPRLAWMRNMLDCVLLVRDAETVSNDTTLQAVQELRRCGVTTVAVIDNFCGQN